MSSRAFNQALKATGYLSGNGDPAAGLIRPADNAAVRLRSILRDERVGLKADAVFEARQTPVAIFKDAGDKPPSDVDVRRWHEAAWNVGLAPLLWIITPTEVRLHDCYASPRLGGDPAAATSPIDRFSLAAESHLRALDAACGRLATETGAFWSSAVGARIDRRHRVDHALLDEINALEERLTQLPPESGDPIDDPVASVKAARDFAQRLIGRCIFTWYLIDRGIARRFLPKSLPPDLSKIFAAPSSAFRLFDWLRTTFNGDLFPMDDPGAERQRLGGEHLALVREFVEGRSLVPDNHGQGRLFQFRFNAIPVDLISSIYQQFARSSAVGTARLQGLHYTPVELVHLTLDPVFEGLPASARVIDPTCGSGAFLVEAFRRLVWRSAGSAPAPRALVRDILYNRLFGIDINRAALGIAAFSLYMAALEFDDEPITDPADLKFDRLIGTTLFDSDTLLDLPPAIAGQTFDAVVGNPPWTFDSRHVSPRRKQGAAETARPRRSPDQAFLNVAAQLAGHGGRIGMLMKASPFFSRDKHALEARNALLRRLHPAAIVNLSALRKEELFPDATGPALLFFARCALLKRGETLLVGSVPWTEDFARNGVFHVGPGELRTVSLARVLRTPAVLKAATFGTVRDTWLIEKLEQEFPTLDELLSRAGIEPTARGQGYQVEGDPIPPPKHYFKLKALEPSGYRPFRLDTDGLPLFRHKTLHRDREPTIFRGPLLICPKASFKVAAELGRYSAAVNAGDLLYTESFYGVSFAGLDARWAYALCAILNSSMASFQLAFGGGAWGLERSTVEPQDLLALRVPDLTVVDNLEPLLSAEAASAAEPNSAICLGALDDAVFSLYGLEGDETILARESVARARMLIFEGHAQRRAFVRRPTVEALRAYAGSLVRVVDGYLRARGRRHLEATVYTGSLRSNRVAGLTAVRFSMGTGAPGKLPIVRSADSRELEPLADLLRGGDRAVLPPYLNERRQLRIYLNDGLFIVKPSETRYWTRTNGLNDADVILADHWFRTEHAVAHA